MISKDDIAALKIAESVSFYYHEKQGTIVARLEKPFSDVNRIYTAREQRLFPETDESWRMRTILVDTSMYGYTDDGSTNWSIANGDHPTATGYASITAPRSALEWHTTVSMLKEGDILTLSWIADNNSETIRQARLHVDRVSLYVKRGDKKLQFHLQTAITYDNSARMIKRNGGF